MARRRRAEPASDRSGRRSGRRATRPATRFASALTLLLAACGDGGAAAGENAGSAPPALASARPAPAAAPSASAGAPPLALFTSLPIYWPESEDIGAMLSDGQAPHWARTLLERDFSLRPIDRLTDLAGERRLLMAQPRALAPDENVALDDWVRGGGRLLLLVDPMLTARSAYALGDRRRPEAIAMLSPILARWGLELRFDDSQPAAPRTIAVGGLDVPVALAGRLAATGGGAASACTVAAQGLLADCRIGKGRALVLADAALVEDAAGSDPAAREALAGLVARAFAASPR